MNEPKNIDPNSMTCRSLSLPQPFGAPDRRAVPSGRRDRARVSVLRRDARSGRDARVEPQRDGLQ